MRDEGGEEGGIEIEKIERLILVDKEKIFKRHRTKD